MTRYIASRLAWCIPVLAGAVTLKWVAADHKLYFSFESADARFSSGRLTLRHSA